MKVPLYITVVCLILFSMPSCSRTQQKTENIKMQNVDDATKPDVDTLLNKKDSLNFNIDTITANRDSIFFDFVLHPFTKLVGNGGNYSETLSGYFGKPLSFDRKPWGNIHQKGQIDSVYVIYFDGLNAGIYKNTAENYELLLTLQIDSSKIHLKYEIGIGDSIGSFIALFKVPYKQNKDDYIFETDSTEALNTLRINVIDGIINKMVFSYYWD